MSREKQSRDWQLVLCSQHNERGRRIVEKGNEKYQAPTRFTRSIPQRKNVTPYSVGTINETYGHRYERCVLPMSAKSRNKHFRKQHVGLLCIRAAQGHRGAKIHPNFFSQQILTQGMRRSSTMSGSSRTKQPSKMEGWCQAASTKAKVGSYCTVGTLPTVHTASREFLTQLVMHIFPIHHPSHRRVRRGWCIRRYAAEAKRCFSESLFVEGRGSRRAGVCGPR